MSVRLGSEASATLARLATAMFPGAGAMPAWRAPAPERIDQILGYRPDSVGEIARGLRLVGDADGDAAWGILASDDPEAEAAIRAIVLGAYYTRPETRAALAYPGQQTRPLDPDAALDFVAARLLDPVIARGPIWRAPPA